MSVWAMFKSLEISGCVNQDAHGVRTEPDETAEFWTVYARHHDGSAQAITDHATKQEALSALERFRALSGLPVTA